MVRNLLLLAVVLVLVFGCGGSGGGSSSSAPPAKSYLELSVVWPTRSRVIPAASESIRTVVRPSLDQPVIGELTLTRPTVSGRIDEISLGTHFVISEALDSNGKVLATRSLQASFLEGGHVEMALDLDSSIVSLAVAPSSLSVGVGDTAPLTASALNARGEVVFLTPSKLEWTIKSGERHALVDLKTGLLTGVSDGEAVVKVLDTESGVSAESRITVVPSPNMQELEPGSDLQTLGFKISDDGSVVVGTTVVNGAAFRWTTSGGTQFIGGLGGAVSLANDVSGDGQVVVGWADTPASGHRAFRWAASGGMQNLGTLGGSASYAYGTNSDGSVVVGSAATADGSQKAFIWKPSSGMKLLDSSLGISYAMGVSSDGSVVVGQAVVDGKTEAFRWTSGGGLQLLGNFGEWSVASAANADGSVIVGTSQVSSTVRKAFVWTSALGMKELGNLGGSTASASDVSADGKVIVGTSQNSEGFERAYSWTAEGGMFHLGTLGGENSTANGVSGDGRFLAGSSLRSTRLAKAVRMLVPQRP